MLYALLAGALPFAKRTDERSNNLVRLQQMFPRIIAAAYEPPPGVGAQGLHLLGRMLTADPAAVSLSEGWRESKERETATAARARAPLSHLFIIFSLSFAAHHRPGSHPAPLVPGGLAVCHRHSQCRPAGRPDPARPAVGGRDRGPGDRGDPPGRGAWHRRRRRWLHASARTTAGAHRSTPPGRRARVRGGRHRAGRLALPPPAPTGGCACAGLAAAAAAWRLSAFPFLLVCVFFSSSAPGLCASLASRHPFPTPTDELVFFSMVPPTPPPLSARLSSSF